MKKTKDEVIIEKQANSVVLYAALGINVVLLIYAIYLSGSILANISNLSITTAMWQMTTESGMMVHGFAILVIVAIGLLHAANQAIGKRSPIIEKIARILLKLPINIILVLLAPFLAFTGYGKFEVGVNFANANGGGYILDWITAATLLFLVLFVKKV